MKRDSAEFSDHIATVCVRTAGGHPGTNQTAAAVVMLVLLRAETVAFVSGRFG